ncbi:MAG: FAD-linked oxidase C-terminal domain-containing protein [Elusimicrobiota bacterium]
MTDAEVSGLKNAFDGELLTGDADLLTYSYDASMERARPDAVAIVRSADEVRRVVSWCAARGVPYVARGAGTNLSGGCVPLKGGVVISLAKLDRILAVDTSEDHAVVEPGVVNLRLQTALAGVGRFYAPDPASHKVCTLGGNAAENAGGPRCLKYGVTANHVRRLEAVMPNGSLETFSIDDAGPEIVSLLIGAEGTLGVITKLWVGSLPLPETVSTVLAAFPTLDAAMGCVTDIIAAGVLPRSLEAMDRATIDSIEAYAPAGYPRAEAVLLIEVEGTPQRVAFELDRIKTICAGRDCGEYRLAADPAQRERLWEGRRSSYAALARLAPNVLVEDGVVPRDRLPEAARRVSAIAREYDIRTTLLFHAGDGNLHPNIVFDERDKALTARVKEAGFQMMRACVELGGSISGEHGIGIDKRAAMGWLYPPETLDLFRRIRRTLDPDGLANPGKILPLPEESAPGRPSRRPRREPTDAARSLIERVREKAGRAEQTAVIGSGTKTPPGLRAKTSEVLTTRPLSAILDFDRANYTVTAEAGITPSELKAALEPEGFYVPLPLLPGTLGGLLATKPWAGLRDGLLGARILLVDGTVAELGAKVVKNVAGYDVPRLLLGSWGTLAIILEATLKLLPFRPEIPSRLPAPGRPRFGRWHTALKKAFDPEGRLNSWVLTP